MRFSPTRLRSNGGEHGGGLDGLMGCCRVVLRCKERWVFVVTRLTVGASNDLQMEQNLTGGLPVMYQGHSTNLDPFRERFSPAHETRSERGDGRMWERVGSRNGQWGKGPDASFEKHADGMEMMTWQNATRKQMTWQQRRITGRHLAHRIRGVTAIHHTTLA